ncbi:MAG: peptide chain release factor 1 [Proteobacteria bacterium]|nr:peptide chain release factor 1 [Pseudomonadota bacterium]
MFENLDGVERRFSSLEDSLSSGSLKGPELTRLTKERASLEPLITAYRQYKALLQERDEAKAMMAAESDDDMVAMAKEELSRIESDLEAIEKHLIVLSLPKDPNDEKNVLLEIRAGTGGDEAALFVADLFRMYTRYAERQRWKIEVLSSTPSGAGGFKEIICMIEGQAVFSRFKFESGVHRVQRVPATENQGRIHTSACTVAILPEAEDVEVNLNPADIEMTVCRSSGSGGQHVNTTDSAVRLVHKPSGLAVECQDERSQHKNREKAMKIMKAKLLEKAEQEQHAEISASRKSQVGSGDRSERIRTYNFPQGRLTDHRINLTLYRLDAIMEGDIGDVLDALGTHHTAELLKQELAV